MNKYLRLCWVVVLLSIYFCLAPFGYVAFSVLHQLPSSDPAARARRLRGIIRRAFTLLHDTMRFCGLMNFRIVGTLPDGPAVLVANHPTLLDVTSVMAAFPDVTTAIKPSIFGRFWFRGLFEDAGFFSGAHTPFELGEVVDAGVDSVNAGCRVLMFPEGTRSPRHGLHAFGRTPFEIACRANVPVVPLVIRCRPVWMSKEVPIISVPDNTAEFQLEALDPVDPKDLGLSSRRLRDVIERRIRENLGVAERCSKTRSNNSSSTLSLTR